jgi:diguanylate cyclase (GGDEF)-like protein/PAS domain S-box-containing protein
MKSNEKNANKAEKIINKLKYDYDLLQSIIDNQPLSFWIKDKEGKYIFVNNTCADYMGASKEDIIGKNDFEIYPKEEASIYVASDKKTLEGDEYFFREAFINGEWEEEYKRIVYDKNGDIIGTTGFARDITDRKTIEEALVESENSKAILLSNLPGVAYRCKNDDAWTMTFLSDGCYELTGYNPEELIDNKSINYYNLIIAEDREKILKKWRIDLDKLNRSNDEYRIITKSGKEKWVWEQSTPVKDHRGEYNYSEGFISDISNIKRATKQIRESEDRFRTIFEEAPLGIGIFDTVTGFVYELNRKFCDILGRTEHELRNLDWRDYSHPDELQENNEKLDLLKKKKISGFSMDKRYYKPDGSIIWVNMIIASFKSESINNIHLCMIEDITESKIKEQEIVYLSYHDVLTGLYNRAFFLEEQKRLDLSRTVPISIIMGDVNGLKLINDSFGHDKGDELLKEIAKILENSCRGEDFAARIGGDEFVILMNHTGADGAQKVCKRIYNACNDYIHSEDKKTFYLSISLGYATKLSLKQNIEEILKDAEDMLYKRKNSEKKKVRKSILQAVKNDLELKNNTTKEQAEQIRKIYYEVGERLGLSTNKLKELEHVMEMHDIGKLLLDENLLLKDISKFTGEELLEYQKHTEAGYRIAIGAPELKNIAEEILGHHENWDGSGFPNGISGERIPLISRIVAVIDRYESFMEAGEWNSTKEKEKALKSIESLAGSYFDPNVVNEFMQVIKKCD